MKKVLLAAVNEMDDDIQFEMAIEECKNICAAVGYEVVFEVTQKSRNMDPATVFRSGKLQELKEVCDTEDFDAVVFYNDLSSSQLQRLKEELQMEVIDRVILILTIFAMRATTKTSQLQVQLAQLQVMKNKKTVIHAADSRQRGGGFANRGGGESTVNTQYRALNRRIHSIRKQLEVLETSNDTQKKKRNNTDLKRVALVGYTNAGKSSLMNLFLKKNKAKDSKDVYSEDMLFATLDTSVRNIKIGPLQFLLYDTVGFVENLPQELLDAFKSTLQAACEADLLLHVVDVNNPAAENQYEATKSILQQIGCGNIPTLTVCNKIDLLKDDQNCSVPGIQISCYDERGFDDLLNQITALIDTNIHEQLFVCYDQLNRFYQHFGYNEYVVAEEKEDGILFDVTCKKEKLMSF